MYIKNTHQRSANEHMLVKNKPKTEFPGLEGPPMLHFRAPLHKHALIRTDIHSSGSVLPPQQKNPTFENLPTLGFNLLLYIISQEKHKNKLPCEVRE